MSSSVPASSNLRRLVVATAMLAALLGPRPVSAFTFGIFDGLEDQIGTWYSNGPNGQATSVNGQIPFTGQFAMAGAELHWTAGSNALRVLAVPTCAARGNSPSSQIDRWGAVDVRVVPLTFLLVREPGELPGSTFDLYIRPRLAGTIEVLSSFNGGIASLVTQLRVAVTVNNQQVSRDSLYLSMTNTNGVNSVFPAAFPKGTANYVVVPNVQEGAVIEVELWAFMRGTIAGLSTVDAYFSLDGTFYSGPGLIVDIGSADAVAVEDAPAAVPLSFAAWPNPFPGSTRIRYTLPSASHVRLSVYDVAGHRVATPVDRFQEAGAAEVEWNGRDAHGAPLAAGVYFAELVAGNQRSIGKLILLGR